jgi:hypothetical protein
MATVKDHGYWVRYIPVEPPEGIPRAAVFCRRESDGQDWYEYVNRDVGPDKSDKFELDSVKCVVEPKGRDKSEEPIVRCAAVDATRLFPQDCQVIELLDVKRPQDEEALIEEFANRHIDLQAGQIGERWQPKPPEDKVTPVLEAILARLDKLEGKS